MVESGSFLQEQAKMQGIDPDRIIFAPFEKNKTEHLYRSRLGDLMLDNWIYNRFVYSL